MTPGGRIDPIGGQAVIEGVMMRSGSGVCMAVRHPEGGITLVKRPMRPLKEGIPALGWPLIRGVATMLDSLRVGVRMLNASAAVASGKAADDSPMEWLPLALGLLFAILLFKVLPAYLFMVLKARFPDVLLLNLIEGGFRTALFLAYLGAISLLPEVRTLFQYHGAEHQTINCFEAGEPLTAEGAASFSPIHPRCGTSFLLLTLLISILVFSLLGISGGSGLIGALHRVALQLLLLPLVAGLSYELIRLAGQARTGSVAGRIAWCLTVPGMWLQRLTTRRASGPQLEVAIASLLGALALGEDDPVFVP